MKQITTYCALASLFFFTTCKKNDLPKTTDPQSPVFYAKCQVNGVPVSIQAGLNDYQMKSSYYMDKNNLYVYKSEFIQNCTDNCGYEFSILINDNQFSDSSGTSTFTDRTLAPGTYSFGNGSSDPLLYAGSFAPLNKFSAATYTWYFNDGTSVKSETAQKTFTPGELVSISMYRENNGCKINFENTFKVGSPLQTQILVNKLGGTKYSFSALTSKTDSYTYTWDFGDNTSGSNLANPEHTFASSLIYYIVTLTLKDGNNNTCTYKYQIAPANTCEANYLASFSPVPNTRALSNVTLLLKDPKGLVYSSNDIQQLVASKFEIVSVEDYSTNENNQRTKKITVNFSCTLKNGTNTINITNGQGVIATAYK